MARTVATRPGETGGKWTWSGTASSPNGTLQLRDYEQAEGAGRELWGEALVGGTWQKVYEVSCKK